MLPVDSYLAAVSHSCYLNSLPSVTMNHGAPSLSISSSVTISMRKYEALCLKLCCNSFLLPLILHMFGSYWLPTYTICFVCVFARLMFSCLSHLAAIYVVFASFSFLSTEFHFSRTHKKSLLK